MSPTADRKKEAKDHRPRLGTWVACSIAAVVVGVGLCASTVGYSISFRRDIDRVATTGVPTTGTVTYTDGGGAQGDSEVCAVVQIEGSRSPECITIADPSHLDAGRVIAVRYDRRNPDHEILVGDLPEPLTANVDALFAVGFLALAMLALAHNLDRRIEARGGTGSRSGWITLTAPLGLTTWIGFLYVGGHARRPRWLLWSAIYLIGMVTAIALDPYGDPAQHAGNLGVVLLVVVWVGGMVHSMLACPPTPATPSAWPPSAAAPSDSRRHRPRSSTSRSARRAPSERGRVVVAGRRRGRGHQHPRGRPRHTCARCRGRPAVPIDPRPAPAHVQAMVFAPTRLVRAMPELPGDRSDPIGSGGVSGGAAPEPRWVYRNGWYLSAIALGGYVVLIFWWLVPLQIAAFEPTGVGSVSLGVAVLVSTTTVLLFILWRIVRMHTTVDRDGVWAAGFGPARSIRGRTSEPSGGRGRRSRSSAGTAGPGTCTASRPHRRRAAEDVGLGRRISTARSASTDGWRASRS